MSRFSKGIVLPQHKEPAFSKRLLRFVNPQTDSLRADFSPIPEGMPEADAIIEAARAAQIVDERDGKLLYRKLLRVRGRAAAVVADAIDDEPYVSSKLAPLLQLRKEAMDGFALCRKVAETGTAFIMVYKMITDLETKIPRSIEQTKVMRLRGGYPAEPPLSKLKVGQGRKLVVGIGALIHLHRAVRKAKRQSTIFATVAGNCVANPANLEISIGMTITQVLERCGLSELPTRVVCGGPMTGVAVLDTERTLITYATRAVLAFRENERDAHYSCIGCGRCQQVCPQSLNPMYIYRFVQNSYYANLMPFDAHLCIGCGTCSYVCPSKLNVAGATQKAKAYAVSHFIPQEKEADELEI